MGEILTPGQWDDLRFQLKRKHPELIDDDMPYYEAEEEDLLCMIEFRLQYYKEMKKQTDQTISFYRQP